MDWELNAPTVDTAVIARLVPTEVLYEFDGPRLFSTTSLIGDLLCYFADADSTVQRFIAAPTNSSIVTNLKEGLLSVRDALDQPWVWFIDVDGDGEPRTAWRGTLKDAPADVLPEKGVRLWPHLEPIFALRAIGEDLKEGQIPMSVIRQVIDGATTALKKVVNVVFDDAGGTGRKAKTIRQFYDLPILGFAYNSFEAAFRLPEGKQSTINGIADETTDAMSEIAQRLERALNWAIESSSSNDPNESLPIELLEALEKLVPPKYGPVKSVEVRGQMFSNSRAAFHLTPEASTRVRQALRAARASEERIMTVTGLLREFDKDNFSFTLRETDDGKDHLCHFAPEFYDELYEAFDRDEQVAVWGRETLKTGEIDVLLVSRK